MARKPGDKRRTAAELAHDLATQTKRCSVCGTRKPFADFYPRQASKLDGFSHLCRDCSRAAVRARWADPETRARDSESHRLWVGRNADYERERKKAWRYRVREHAKAKYREYQRQRRARLIAQFVSEIDEHAVLNQYAGCCALCGQPIDPTLAFPHALSFSVDHIVPLARGGTHEQANVQPAHVICNKQKFTH